MAQLLDLGLRDLRPKPLIPHSYAEEYPGFAAGPLLLLFFRRLPR